MTKKKKQSSKEYHALYREIHREKRRQWNREWIENNRDRYNASKYKYRDNLKKQVMDIYSGGTCCCKYCGVDDIDVLCIDHIKNDGAEHRESLGASCRGRAGISFYEALKREGFPDGLQVLCANCNLKKETQRKRNIRLKNKFYAEYYNSV